MNVFLGRCLDVVAEGVGNVLMLAYVGVVAIVAIGAVVVMGWAGLLVAVPLLVLLGIFARVMVTSLHDDLTT
jgi:hypothetical protein